MKQRVQISLFVTLLSILVHVYLSLHYYPLKLGAATGQSMCNLNPKFNCDAVSMSAYSAFLGIPLSVWGFVFNLVLFAMILLSWLEWTERPERLRRWTFLFSIFGVLASVVMGLISLTVMHNYCLFCIGLYVASAVTFWALRGTLREPWLSGLMADIPLLWSESKGIIAALILVPAGSWIVHQMFMQNLGADQLAKAVTMAQQDWASAPKFELVAKPTLVVGPSAEQATMVISEFADFRCGHCAHASHSLDAFVSARPDVRFEFYVFPLDGTCNEALKQQGGDGISCRLSLAANCAEKSGQGWALHKAIFAHQNEFNGMGQVSEVDKKLNELVSRLGLNWDSFELCLNQSETLDLVKAQAKQGELVQVRGTPSIFVNGKLLRNGQVLPILQSVYDELKKSKVN